MKSGNVRDRFAVERKWLPVIACVALVLRAAHIEVPRMLANWDAYGNLTPWIAAIYLPILLLPWVVRPVLLRALLASIYVIQAVFVVLNVWIDPQHPGVIQIISIYTDVPLLFVAVPLITITGVICLGRWFLLTEAPLVQSPATRRKPFEKKRPPDDDTDG